MAAPPLFPDPHMRPSDAFTWYMERDPLLRSTVVAVGMLDRSPDPARLRRTFERATFVVPGMRHVVRTPPLRLATPRWTVTDEVDLDWHLQWVNAPGGGLADVLAVARSKATTAFDPARPLWEVTVVDGLRDGRAAFVMKFHHAITDGVGGMRLALEVFDLHRDGTAARPEPPRPEPEHLDTPRLAWDALRHETARALGIARAAPGTALRTAVRSVTRPRETLSDFADAARSVVKTVEPYRTTLSPLMRERRLGRTLDVLEVPTKALQRAGAGAQAHLNDAFVGAVTGGLRIYHERHGAQIDQLRVTMPISLRTAADGPGGNRITLARFPLPAGLHDPSERMRAIHEVTDGWRHEPSLGLTQPIAAGLNLLPSSVVGGILKHVDFLASDVPGLPMRIHLAGAEIEAYYPFGPTIGSSVNVTLLSYVDTCYVGINCDTGAIPDADFFVQCLRDGLRGGPCHPAAGGARTPPAARHRSCPASPRALRDRKGRAGLTWM